MPAGAGRALRRVGALVEGPAFHPYLSGRANLARLDAADRSSRPAHVPGAGSTPRWTGSACWPRPQKRYRAYSLGMRQRLAIASALLMPRDLLVLDEPTNGLDPQGTREVRHLIGDLADDGATVLVSSHLLAEVEQMCSHVGVMYEGRLVAAGTDRRAAGRARCRPSGWTPTGPRTPPGCCASSAWPTSPIEAGSRHRDARRRRGGEDRARTW